MTNADLKSKISFLVHYSLHPSFPPHLCDLSVIKQFHISPPLFLGRKTNLWNEESKIKQNKQRVLDKN